MGRSAPVSRPALRTKPVAFAAGFFVVLPAYRLRAPRTEAGGCERHEEEGRHDLTLKLKKELSDEEREYTDKRKQIQERLTKFATRIPAHAGFGATVTVVAIESAR